MRLVNIAFLQALEPAGAFKLMNTGVLATSNMFDVKKEEQLTILTLHLTI